MRNEIYDHDNSTGSVNIKISLQTGSPDHREINWRIICQSEDFSVDAVRQIIQLVITALICSK